MSHVKWDAVLSEQLPPGFIPNVSIRKKKEKCHNDFCANVVMLMVSKQDGNEKNYLSVMNILSLDALIQTTVC